MWFGFSHTVNRATYLGWGIALMAAKYLIDSALVLAFTGSWWPPLQYLSPLYEMRTRGLHHLDTSEVLALGAVTLPFFWIGVSMSVRRAADAGLPPVVGLGFAIPVLNWLDDDRAVAAALRAGAALVVETPGGAARNLKGALIGMVLAIVLGMVEHGHGREAVRRLRPDPVLRHAIDDGHVDRPASPITTCRARLATRSSRRCWR